MAFATLKLNSSIVRVSNKFGLKMVNTYLVEVFYIRVPILQSLHKMLRLELSSCTLFGESGHSLQSTHHRAAVLMHTPHLQTEPVQISADFPSEISMIHT